MRVNITDDVTQCDRCRQYFIQGVEGDGSVCDRCADTSSGAADVPREFFEDHGGEQ